MIRVQKSNWHIAGGYRKLIRAFKREAVQSLVAKNLVQVTYRWKPFLPFKRELQTVNPTARARDILTFAISHEKVDAKGLLFELNYTHRSAVRGTTSHPAQF